MSFPADPDEPIFRMRTHPKVLFPPVMTLLGLFVVAGLMYRYVDADILGGKAHLVGGVLLAGVGARYAGYPLLRWWCKTYTITTHEIVKRNGILWRNSYTIPIARITRVSCQRGILDRIFRCGTLILSDAGVAGAGGMNPQQQNNSPAGIPLKDIPRVLHVEKVLNTLLRQRQGGGVAGY